MWPSSPNPSFSLLADCYFPNFPNQRCKLSAVLLEEEEKQKKKIKNCCYILSRCWNSSCQSRISINRPGQSKISAPLCQVHDQKMLSPEETLLPKSRKKKASLKVSVLPAQGDGIKKLQDLGALPYQAVQKPPKRGLVNDSTDSLQQDKSTSDSLPDSSSSSGNDYRTLRRKYLLLEEESFGLGKELQDVEDEMKALEEEKLALLDELIVLEGLVDPPEMPSRPS